MCFGDFKNGTISTAITVSDIASIAIFVRNMNASLSSGPWDQHLLTKKQHVDITTEWACLCNGYIDFFVICEWNGPKCTTLWVKPLVSVALTWGGGYQWL